MVAYLVVALGAAVGGAFRHGINVTCARLWGTGWPYGTFAVNLIGSALIGAIVGFFALRAHLPKLLLLFLTTGILGGFTTFSAFSLDAVMLYERGELAQAVLYVVASVVASIAALVAAVVIVRRLT